MIISMRIDFLLLSYMLVGLGTLLSIYVDLNTIIVRLDIAIDFRLN